MGISRDHRRGEGVALDLVVGTWADPTGSYYEAGSMALVENLHKKFGFDQPLKFIRLPVMEKHCSWNEIICYTPNPETYQIGRHGFSKVWHAASDKTHLSSLMMIGKDFAHPD